MPKVIQRRSAETGRLWASCRLNRNWSDVHLACVYVCVCLCVYVCVCVYVCLCVYVCVVLRYQDSCLTEAHSQPASASDDELFGRNSRCFVSNLTKVDFHLLIARFVSF